MSIPAVAQVESVEAQARAVAALAADVQVQGFFKYLRTERNVSVHTLDAYQRDLVQGIGLLKWPPVGAAERIPWEQLNLAVGRQFIMLLQREGLARVSVRRKLSSLRAFCRFLVREGVLPGNPLAHYVCFHLFVKPALKAMQGLTCAIPFQKGCLSSPLDAGENPRETYWLAFAAMKNGGFEITPIPWQSSGDITALAKANALIQVPSSCGLLGMGAPVRFLPTRSL